MPGAALSLRYPDPRESPERTTNARNLDHGRGRACKDFVIVKYQKRREPPYSHLVAWIAAATGVMLLGLAGLIVYLATPDLRFDAECDSGWGLLAFLSTMAGILIRRGRRGKGARIPIVGQRRRALQRPVLHHLRNCALLPPQQGLGRRMQRLTIVRAVRPTPAARRRRNRRRSPATRSPRTAGWSRVA